MNIYIRKAKPVQAIQVADIIRNYDTLDKLPNWVQIAIRDNIIVVNVGAKYITMPDSRKSPDGVMDSWLVYGPTWHQYAIYSKTNFEQEFEFLMYTEEDSNVRTAFNP